MIPLRYISEDFNAPFIHSDLVCRALFIAAIAE